MRLWTLHPRYLDAAGLVALWREALLARAVLRGLTRGYRHHPQLQRFLALDTPRSAINAYLAVVLVEAESRGYRFDRRKVGSIGRAVRIGCTDGQMSHEWQHLLRKLRVRSPAAYGNLRAVIAPEAHPLFDITHGPVEGWERIVDVA